MTVTEKVAYLKGLAEGMKIDETTNEGKLLLSIIDTLDDVALSISDLEDNMEELSAQVDEIDDDLGTVEEDLYGDDDECSCGDDEDDDETLYEVECPSCGDVICLDEGMLEEGEIDCPNCGEKLEFDLEDDEDGSEGCGCGHHDEE
jgi:DNA-directed RNA polymerase subunit RPC12/RpoP